MARKTQDGKSTPNRIASDKVILWVALSAMVAASAAVIGPAGTIEPLFAGLCAAFVAMVAITTALARRISGDLRDDQLAVSRSRAMTALDRAASQISTSRDF